MVKSDPKGNISTKFEDVKKTIVKKSNIYSKPLRQPKKIPTYRVVTYQIPVPLGDCSVHLLVDSEVDTKGDVVAAFLMDGGVTADNLKASKQISRALEVIDKEHGDDWKFQAWVVTHWDADHFYGVIELFEASSWYPCRTNSKSYFTNDKVLCCGGDPNGLFVKLPSSTMGTKTDLMTFLSQMGFTFNDKLSGENLIGMDLFSGNYVIDWKTGNPSVNLNELERPQFCVLAANGYGIAQSERYTDALSRNQTSVLSILFWPKTKRCSYYTGGDGYPAVARKAIIPFLNNISVTVLKLDHHGSSGELLGVASDRVTEDIVSIMEPQKVLVTPGHGYGHPSWDVIAFLYDHYRSGNVNPRDRLYTTRSPYWAQEARVSGMDINLGKIRKIWKILEKWKTKPTDDIVTSWDAWKADFQMSDLDEPDDLTDESYRPDSDIVNAAVDAQLFDQIGKEAEDAIFEKFVKDFIELAKRNPDEAFKALQKRPTKIEDKMFTQQQWRELFVRWKWTIIKAYRKALKVALEQKVDVPELAQDNSAASQGIEALITRQQERTAWADTMRLLWNELSPQFVNPDPGQSQWFLVRLTSKDSSTQDGAIRIYTPEGGQPEVFETNLRGPDTRLYTEEMGWTKKDFAAQKLSDKDEKKLESFAFLWNKERELKSELLTLKKSPGNSELKVTKTTKATKQKILKVEANLLELKKKMYMN